MILPAMYTLIKLYEKQILFASIFKEILITSAINIGKDLIR